MEAEIEKQSIFGGYHWRLPVEKYVCYYGYSITYWGAVWSAKRQWKKHNTKKHVLLVKVD